MAPRLQGSIPEDYCINVHNESPDAWMTMWEREIARLQPTAVIVSEVHQALSFYGFCYRHGIRIPEDISVVAMAYSEDATWLTPELSMCQYPAKKGTLHFISWVQNDLNPVGIDLVPLELGGTLSMGMARRDQTS